MNRRADIGGPPRGRLGSVYGLAIAELATFRPLQASAYLLSTLAFLASLALLLLGLVEMRRGFLFPLSDYIRVGAPTAIMYFDPRQLPLMVVGGLGVWLSYRRLAALEGSYKGRSFKTMASLVAVAILVLLVADIVIYRGVPALRIAAAGGTGVGHAIPLTAFPAWAQFLREGLNYLALVWHATLLAILLGALFLTLMAKMLRTWLSGQGLRAHLKGAILAVPQPFCSCCSAPIGATLYRQGVSLGPTLAFVVSSPMLNVTGLLLAAMLLPWKFAVLRLAGGIVIGILVTYMISLLATRWTTAGGGESRSGRTALWFNKAMERYAGLFRFERLVGEGPADSPAALISTWLITTWRLGRVIVPVVLAGSVVTAATVLALPSPQNNLIGVVVAAAFGTLFMVPTWTEIPVTSQLVKEGLTGPAATLLLTLPAVSVPCLAVISGAVASLRVSLLLGLAVFAIGVMAGLIFLAL